MLRALRGRGSLCLGLGIFIALFFIVFTFFSNESGAQTFGFACGLAALGLLGYGAVLLGMRKRLYLNPNRKSLEETNGLFAEDHRQYHPLTAFNRVILDSIDIRDTQYNVKTQYQITFSGIAGVGHVELDAGTYSDLPSALDSAIRITRLSGLPLYDRSRGSRTVVLTPERAAAMREDIEMDEPWWRRKSVIAIICMNLVPLASVLIYGWDGTSLVILFWSEGWVIAFFTVLKALVNSASNNSGISWFIEKANWTIIYLFLFVPYVIVLWLIIVQTLDIDKPGGSTNGLLEQLWLVLSVRMTGTSGLWISLAIIFVGHGISFISDYIGGGEYRRTPMLELAKRPFINLAAVLFVITSGVSFIDYLRSPGEFLALVVGIKLMLDIYTHLREQRRFSAAEYDRKTSGRR